MKITGRYCQGSSLIEGLLAILIFSVGLISILMLLTSSLKEVGNAKYRSEASLLASSVIAEMWTGDRSLANLINQYDDKNGLEYRRWREIVITKLPGITASKNQPEITVNDKRKVTVNIKWQVPGEENSHNLITSTVIID